MAVARTLELRGLVTRRIPLSGVEAALRAMGAGQASGITIFDDFAM